MLHSTYHKIRQQINAGQDPQVTPDEVRELIEMIDFLNMSRGIMGYDEEGRMLVSAVGIVPIIKDLFVENNIELGEPSKFEVHIEDKGNADFGEQWLIEASYDIDGHTLHYTSVYSLEYIMSKRAIRFVP